MRVKHLTFHGFPVPMLSLTGKPPALFLPHVCRALGVTNNVDRSLARLDGLGPNDLGILDDETLAAVQVWFKAEVNKYDRHRPRGNAGHLLYPPGVVIAALQTGSSRGGEFLRWYLGHLVGFVEEGVPQPEPAPAPEGLGLDGGFDDSIFTPDYYIFDDIPQANRLELLGDKLYRLGCEFEAKGCYKAALIRHLEDIKPNYEGSHTFEIIVGADGKGGASETPQASGESLGESEGGGE